MSINLTVLVQIVLLFAVLATLGSWLLAIVDCIRFEEEQKALWLALLVVGGIIAGPIYWFLRRPQRERAQVLSRYGNQRSDWVDAVAQSRSSNPNPD